ncbi:prephenate dehydrogenase [Sphaerisporangium rufum]|uniref:Prephenate dehydrogenase n=1 Tax=Sphaerisporangium rufum TaxID=1381558 RepID=A0A919UWP0_9ACTN|nr:prephenate dehydrogenase [Sphaerisporangium rufum]GII76211.1 prephenate dehydrogenase [Sphaerisporangium rufum]
MTIATVAGSTAPGLRPLRDTEAAAGPAGGPPAGTAATAVRRVTVIGTGVIGTSVALGLRRAGVDVALADRDAASLAQAELMGAGTVLGPETPPADVVVIATPPSTVPAVLRDAQRRGLGAAYTDVASTKAGIVAAARRAGCDLATYVPGHPMAGREISGPAAGRAGLFEGRPWALCPAGASPAAVALVTGLVLLCGGVPRAVAAAEHDRMVAAVSHAPHVVAAALAARFAEDGADALVLAGQGLRDTTRIAAGPPELWSDILRQNAGPVAAVLEAVAADLAAAAAALRAAEARTPGPRPAAEAGRTGASAPGAGHPAAVLAGLLSRGNLGRARIATPADPDTAPVPAAPAQAWVGRRAA